MNIFQNVFEEVKSFIQMVMLNLTSFGLRGKLSHYSESKDNVKHLSCIIFQGICSCGNHQKRSYKNR